MGRHELLAESTHAAVFSGKDRLFISVVFLQIYECITNVLFVKFVEVELISTTLYAVGH